MLTQFILSTELSVLALCSMFILIVLGASLQVVTGVGLGVISGPALLFFLDSIAAIQIAIVLNLLLTVCLLLADRANVAKAWFLSLSLWSAIGVPCGFVFILFIDQGLLRILGALFILMAVLQLKYFPAQPAQSMQPSYRMRIAGYFSGVFAGALAAPGPIALWTLLSHGADALTARATIRFYFVVVYSFALLLQLVYAGLGEGVVDLLRLLLPALLIGIACGLIIRRVVTPASLMKTLELILIFMGFSLLVKGVIDVV